MKPTARSTFLHPLMRQRGRKEKEKKKSEKKGKRSLHG
jgi:hypothetical protein